MPFLTVFGNETGLTNGSFLLLLVSFIFYWIYSIFANVSTFGGQRATVAKGDNDSLRPEVGTAVNGLTLRLPLSQKEVGSSGSSSVGWNWPQLSLGTLGTFSMAAANLALAALMGMRWQHSGHFPLSNLYESLIFLSWCCTVLHLVLEKWSAAPWLGAFTAPSALCLQSFATFSLPMDMQQPSPLVPALQSNWLMMHVTVMLLSYAGLMLGALLSIAYLVLMRTTRSTSAATWAENLDGVSYRLIGVGFAFLTMGILSGAVWANEAWGSYWSWDPKETWALLTWLVFAIYLHSRLTKGWTGQKPAWIASVGFLTVWICFLGVNLLGEGLHSYGFFNS